MGKKKNKENTLEKLLSEVRLFHKASLCSEYYESFNVNSKNYMNLSSGTEKWIRQCNSFFNRCVSESRHSYVSTREILSILFELLRHIDEGYDDIVFFADEAGSWQVGVDWDKILPVWFRCLSETANSDEFSKESIRVIDDFVNYDRKKFLIIAHKKATTEQSKMLPDE